MDRYSANTLDTREFITDQVVWSLIVYMWYRLIFRCVGRRYTAPPLTSTCSVVCQSSNIIISEGR